MVLSVNCVTGTVCGVGSRASKKCGSFLDDTTLRLLSLRVKFKRALLRMLFRDSK